jgi:hypothetical protein
MQLNKLNYSTRANIMTVLTALYIISIGALFIYPAIITVIILVVITVLWALGLKYFLPTED